MIRYLLTVLALLLVAFILRQFVPVLPQFYDARLFLVPLVFICASVTLDVLGMLLLSFVCGLLWDAQHTILPVVGDVEVYPEVSETLKFGYSIFLFAIAGFIMQGVQPVFREGKWQVSVLVTGVALFFYLFVEWMLLSFVRGHLVFTTDTLKFIFYSSVLTMLFSPLVFLILFKLAKLYQYRIRYEGLRKGRQIY
ncbi:hypothetical protein [Roseibacillus persicicus]|uniref:Rod shape-determining protein MreD n=1 Tax=Roseibacillus persicicus TaxID=454148 RepID=A0A918TH56_9BACT|nr:hypothetical protein [Roseibacillus persicicus]MDQ8191964.1 hypothetical protein [Roseibacillus persicicus]GHC47660.1 hypothetical protein GCM10007100_11790 [Roseibacillus persicicus]